jgi:non-heme chloroperoxidase
MPYVTVDKENSGKVKLCYEDHGSGQPVVMIHGFPLSGDAWEKQKLALLRKGYRTITYDRRGFGRSDKPAFGYDYDTLTNDLEHIMNELDLRDVVLVGHSMGTGEVAHYLGTRGSDRVSRAVLMSPLQPFLLKTEDNPEGLGKDIFEAIQAAIRDDRPAYLTSFFNDFYNLDENLDERISEEAVRLSWNIASTASPVGTHDCVDAWMTDFRPDLANIDVPVMVIHGDADRILPYAVTAKRLEKEYPDFRLVTLHGAPHGMAWTHGDEINAELLAFVAAEEYAAEQPEPVRRQRPAFGETLDRDD